MTINGDLWERHQEKAEKALVEARFLLDAGYADGAYARAVASCVQIAKSVAIRLSGPKDNPEWMRAIRAMMADGRLPSDLAKPYGEIMNVHAQDRDTSLFRGEKEASDMVTLAETFRRVLSSAAEVSASRTSPAVIAAAAKKGVVVPRFT
jgi:hypothetical protein